MRKSNLLINLLVAWLCTMSAGSAYAQLAAAFSANKTEGCAPLVVQFRDESTGNPNEWRWDLGNGTISFLQNPAATYFNTGTYTVKLVVKRGNQQDSVVKTQYIVVYASPTINFVGSDSSGCYPLTVQFTDLSAAGDGTISSWLWDFGDGDTSSLPNPAHTYTAGGNYNVSLQVRNSRGCIQSITRLNYIRLNNGVKADFDVGSSSNCNPPTAINFSNKSSGTGSLSYQWFFGDGSVSTQANPSHTYLTPGTYTVKLLVRNNTGCVDSMVKPNTVVIGSVSAAFTHPPVICVGRRIDFTNNSTPAPSGARWDFGDNSFSTAISPSKTYNSPGFYNIKLVSFFGACMDSIVKAIQVIPKPSGDFLANPTNSCKAPLSVAFQHSVSGAISYKWIFGDGDSSALPNPTHTYTLPGTYSVSLIVTNAAGCTDTIRKNNFINIQRPQVTITPLPQEGCIPFHFQPVFIMNTPDSIISTQWHLGDGSVSSLRKPSHTYTVAGVYTVKLFYTTLEGCSDSVVVTNAVRVGEKPIVNFSATPRFACAFQPIRFTDLSSGPTGDRWLWTFGDGGTSTEKNPEYTYQDTGWFSVTLIVWSNGCSDSVSIPNYIYIKPPVARFVDSSGCSSKFTRWFTDRSIGATSWFWSFGDGSNSTDQHPVHSYAIPGSYIVTLTVKNDTCEHTISRQIIIVAETAAFSARDTIVCKGSPVSFSPQGVSTQNIQNYQWDFGDGNSGSGASPVHIYSKAGTYSVRLVVTDINGCSDTLIKSQYIKVNGPTANFEALNPAICNLSTVVFSDSSYSDGVHPIRQWIWDYGDGQRDSLTSPPFQHLYSSPGQFAVTLTVVDSIGCTDRLQRNSYLLVSKPYPAFLSPDTLSCTNKTIRFINQTSGNGPFQFNWSFSNASTSPASQPTTTYSNEGDYAIKLFATDRYGCKDSLVKNDYIKIRNPRANFLISDSVATCPPLVVNFSNQSQNFIRHEWDFGDGTRSMVANPVHFYTYPGVYKARLTVTSYGGCVDTLVKTITVRGPQGSFRYDNLGGCEPITVRFTGTTKDTVSFIWDFNDGVVVQTADSIITHTYNRRGFYLPKMILKDPQGCQVSIPGPDTIRVFGVDAKFGTSAQLFCDSGRVEFRDSSQSNDIISAYQWDFGDGNQSLLPNPSHFYRQTGTYPIKLRVRTQRGCVDTVQLPLPIRISASPIVGITADTGACVPALANFSARIIRNDTASLQWQWNFGNGSTSTLQNPAPVAYNVAGSYSPRLIATNSLGCADTVFHSYTAYPLPATNAGADQVICRNSVTDLVGSGALQYRWSPASGLSCTDCPAPKASPTQNTMYYLLGKNIYGCFASDSVLITVQQPFNLEVSKGDTLCLGESIQLLAAGTDQYLWSPALGLDNNRIHNPRARPDESVTYQVVGRDKYGCFSDTGFVPVLVYPYPKVNAGADQTISVGESVPLKAELSRDVVNIKWSPPAGLSCINCPDPVAKPRQTSTYTLEVVNEGGCISKDDITVFVFCDNSNLFMPNTFSPNGDGNNDVFYPRGKGLFSVRGLRIFNRWGELVFEKMNFDANDSSKGWNGTHKGKPSPQDVYVYTIDIICENQVVLKYSGNVALIR